MPSGVYTPRFPGQEAEVPNQSTSDSLQPSKYNNINFVIGNY